ncbi:HlyD family efflux transporter periplasmic adaptor subunit, partial [Pseudomonas aeruginosa]
AAVAATQAQLDAARLNLSFTRITAPIDGRVSRAEVTAGNLVNSGETLLTTLVSTDKVYAYFDADERVSRTGLACQLDVLEEHALVGGEVGVDLVGADQGGEQGLPGVDHV